MEGNFGVIKSEKIHFIGIGGISMSALAKYCLKCGKMVSGSDRVKSELTDELIKMGADIYIGHSEHNLLNKDLVVYTSAIDDKNEELCKAIEQNIPIIKRSEFLNLIISEYKYSIAVSGSHGKTTTTSMITDMLVKAGYNPTSFIGGFDLKYGNFLYGNKNVAVFEACEYRKNFLDIEHNISVILNIDNDHLDSYKDISDEIETFRKFALNGISIINADDKYAKKLINSTSITFGIDNKAGIIAKDIKRRKNGYCFSVVYYNKKIGKIYLPTFGKHNIYNALATIAVSDVFKIPFSTVKRSLRDFKGIKRRNELLGVKENTRFFADYAHHPTEISAMIKEYSGLNGKSLFIFQPHTYSRTRMLLEDFVNAFICVKDLIIYKTYPARERFDENGSAKTLYNEIKKENENNVLYFDEKDKLLSFVKKNYGKYDNVIFLGAGDIYDIARNLF